MSCEEHVLGRCTTRNRENGFGCGFADRVAGPDGARGGEHRCTVAARFLRCSSLSGV